LALAAVNEAWGAFYQTTKVESEKELAKQGWKTIRAISTESKMTVAAISCRVEYASKRITAHFATNYQTSKG